MTQEVKCLLYKPGSLNPVSNPGTSSRAHVFDLDLHVLVVVLTSTVKRYRKASKDSGHKDSNGFYTLYVKCLLSWHGISRCCHTALEFGTNCPHTWACQVLSTIGVCPQTGSTWKEKAAFSLPPSPASFRAFILSASALFRVFLNLVLQCLNYEPLSDISHLS